MPEAFFTEPTTGYWQEITADIPARFTDAPPYRYGYPVRLPDGRILVLPLRQLPSGGHAVASLIANQAAHVVIAALADAMAEQSRIFEADIVVGLPTLGFAFADRVAERLGHPRFVPLGYSRKFWYDDVLSEAVQSITSPEPGKLLRLDPNMLPLLDGRRIVLVDDAISTGSDGRRRREVAAAHRRARCRHRGGDETDQSLAGGNGDVIRAAAGTGRVWLSAVPARR